MSLLGKPTDPDHGPGVRPTTPRANFSAMRVTEIVNAKGSDVHSLESSASVTELVQKLAQNKIGALLIIDGDQLVGIVSERDVVRFVAGGGDLSAPVGDIMTTDVATCSLDDEIESLATVMTGKRVRHLPVVEDGKVLAIVSIGDVVKGRLDELQAERDHLADYVSS